MVLSNVYEDLQADLIYLRKDRGVVPARLRNASTLLRLLGGSGQDFTDLRTRFISAINSLQDKQSIATLLAAYGLLPEYANLSQLAQRRKLYGRQVRLKSDAIAKHENAAIRELAIQLLTACYTFSPLPFSPSVMPHNAALHEYVEVTTLVKDRLWQETRECYRIISLVDDVGWLEISSDIPAKVALIDNEADNTNRKANPTTNTARQRSARHNAVTQPYKATTDPSSHGLRHRFYFAQPLMRGQLTELSFAMTPDSTLADPDSLVLIEETRAFHEPTLAAKFEIVFVGQKPSVVWRYDHLAIYERPGTPSKQQLLDLSQGRTTATFADLYGGMYSGVAWEW